MKKTIALLLTFVMLIGSVIIVSATETTDTGTKIKRTDWTLSAVTSGASYSVDETDENALTVTNKSTGAIDVIATTKVDGLTLEDGKVYTIDFSLGYKKYGYGKYGYSKYGYHAAIAKSYEADTDEENDG